MVFGFMRMFVGTSDILLGWVVGFTTTGAEDVTVVGAAVEIGDGVDTGVGVAGVDGGDCLILMSLIFGEIPRFFDSNC